jgi:putative copper resistance protein D
VLRVRRRHPGRPWPLWRSALFLGGLAVIVIATQSGIGRYDGVLFWDHMILHLLLIMVAPPLLVVGQPITLLLHASRNPLHTWVKKAVRSRVVSAITFPPFGAVLYLATIVGTHLTSFENVVLTDPAVRNAELALYLIAGYLYFLPLIGREPVRWRVSYPSRIFLLFIAMPVDAFTGLILGSDSSNPFPALATLRPSWAPRCGWGEQASCSCSCWRCSSPGAGKPAAMADSAGWSPRAGRISPPWSARTGTLVRAAAHRSRPARLAARKASMTTTTSWLPTTPS